MDFMKTVCDFGDLRNKSVMGCLLKCFSENGDVAAFLKVEKMMKQQFGEVPAYCQRLKVELAAEQNGMDSPETIALVRNFADEWWNLGKNGQLEKINDIISRGVDINMKNRGGYTALHEAAWFNQEEAVVLLLKN